MFSVSFKLFSDFTSPATGLPNKDLVIPKDGSDLEISCIFNLILQLVVVTGFIDQVLISCPRPRISSFNALLFFLTSSAVTVSLTNASALSRKFLQSSSVIQMT